MNRTLLLLILFVFIFLIDYYSFQAVKILIASSSESFQKTIKHVYFSITILVLLAFLIYNFGNPDWFGKHVRTFLIFFIFINVLAKTLVAAFLLIDDIQRGVRWLYAKLSNPEAQNSEGTAISRSKFLATTGIVVAAAPVLSMSWGIISGAHDYRIRKIKVPIKGLPKALDGIRIGQLSDIHSGSFWNKTAVKGGVEMLVNEKVDVALFTGDLVNNRASEMQEWGNIFSKITAPLGVYSVFGNHDYGDYVDWGTLQKKQKNLTDLALIHQQMGWDLLSNEHRVLDIQGEKLGIVGVENWSAKGRFPKYGKLDFAMQNMEETAATILLSHDPSHWQAEVVGQNPRLDLTLSGHTHGMQFGVDIPGFKWSPIQYVYDEWAGLYQANQQYLYVNRGFGYIGYPGRVGILPEISILTLERV